VPRPTPVSPLKPTVSKREPTTEPSLIGKDVNCINHHTGDKVQIPNCMNAPPIKLKLKLSGKEIYIENNENSGKDGDKKHRKHKKKKKERHKEHLGGVKHHKEKLRSKGHKKLHNRKEKHGTSPQTEAVRVPRLKIRIGPEAPALVITPPVKSPASPLDVQPSNSTSIDKAIGKTKLPPVITTAQAPTVSSEPLAVEFSATDGLGRIGEKGTWEANMAEQVERAFLKQPTINLNNKARILAGNKKVPRYVRNIGLGFKTPLE
ncbi:hypothetical protein TELCIR_19120, partial [Teladorsagia circumcincta]